MSRIRTLVAWAIVVQSIWRATLVPGGAAETPDDPCAPEIAPGRAGLFRAARNWAYQIQGIDAPGAVEALETARYDVLVIEPTRTDRDNAGFPTRQVVARLKASRGATDERRKLILAYVDVGEAEDWRWYWENDWVAPTDTQQGDPDFLLTIDPDGWSGNYPVAFWDPRWQSIIATSPTSALHKVLDDGFDGIYMDWIEAYSHDPVAAAAQKAGVEPDDEMIAFVARIRSTARAIDPEFLIVPQNAPELGYNRPGEYLPLIDGIGQEDVHFSGGGDVPWGQPGAGGIRTPDGTDEHERQWLYERLSAYQNAGLPVFNCDYCLEPSDIEEAYRLSLAQGYIPFVSQTPLDRLPPYYPLPIPTSARHVWLRY